MDVPSDSLAALARAVNRSKRTSSVQLPIPYIKLGGVEDPMVAKLLRGGRGGDVRLKTHLTLFMQATAKPHTLPIRPARTMSKALGLDDRGGPRRVSDALQWLHQEKLIKTVNDDGSKQLQVLDPTGSGAEWSRDGGRYVGLPIELWSNGWIILMTGRALAVFLTLTELCGGKDNPKGEVMDGIRKRQYGFSDDTWTRATKELETLGLLTTTSEPFGDDDWPIRRRKRYLLREIGPEISPDWANLD